jgi:hypothetical protein
MEEIPRITGALPGIDLTILLPPEALEAGAGLSGFPVLPPEISVGLVLTGKHSPKDADSLRESLESARERISSLTGGNAGFAKVGHMQGVDLRGFLKKTGYLCFLDGRGFNRYGDEPHVLRLVDATPFASAGKGGRKISIYIDLYKGKHYVWPAALITRSLSRQSKVGED